MWSNRGNECYFCRAGSVYLSIMRCFKKDGSPALAVSKT